MLPGQFSAHLMIHPSVQRKGLGQKLLDWDMDVADRDGLPIYLESTPDGKPLYERYGSSIEGQLCEPSYPGDEPYVSIGMKRLPKG